MEFHNDYDSALSGKYYLAGRRLGAPTSPMTPKQLDEFGKRLNEGIQNVEIGTLEPDKFETIPKEHFKEIKRLAKITNANMSMHAPLIEASGFEERKWSEQKRIANEKQIGNVLERASELGENTHVVLHGANVFGQQWEKDLKKQGGEEEALRTMRVVNEETGEMTDLQYDERQRLMSEREREERGLKKGEKIILDPESRLKMLNRTEWDKSVLELFKFQHTMDEVQDRVEKKKTENFSLVKANLMEEQKARYERNDRDISIMNGHLKELNNNLRSQFDEIYNKIERFSSDEKDVNGVTSPKETNIKIIKGIKEKYEEADGGMDKLENEYYNYARKMKEAKSIHEQEKLSTEIQAIANKIEEKEAIKSKVLIEGMQNIRSPEVWKPVKDFAIEKASTTIAGAAFDAYNKFGEKAPVLCIENSYPEMPLSRAKDLRKGIEEARSKFVDKVVKEKGLSKDEAKDIAKRLIGATWDIGHINLLRRAGYSEKELKELLKEETSKIGSLVKHVHITDNFGFNDTHLPPGMGNVPIKEMLQELEKKGWKEQGIIEAGNFVKEFETSPFPTTLEYFGSPVYESGGRFKENIYGSSFGSYIDFPKQHFDLYGSGFSTLPKELGGDVGGGERGRFAQGESEQ